ncbi:MAG TPA: hypothetical protein VHM91_16290 [Verrucomicrobiales bacterium]|jgi:hypothetical protein|nr:hypothetical protein [Verrucomicrobiales bacterium]
MKTFLFLATFLTGLASTAWGGIAAKDALRTLARERGTSWLDRIVQVGGDHGADQPGAWHIVAKNERGGLQEFFVGAKGIISEGKVPASAVASFSGPQIPQKLWTWDSTNAFAKAEAAAKKAQVGYHTADYRLRSPSGNPVWTLQLNNGAGQKVADVTVSAASGKVLNFVAYHPAPPPPPPPPQTSSQQALEKTKEVINRGAQGLGRGLNKAGGWIRRKFAPNPPPAPGYDPPVSPRGSAN